MDGDLLNKMGADEQPKGLRREPMPTKMTGKIKFFDADRGFGSVVPDAGGAELFVHITSCPDGIDYLTEGQRVRFEEQPSRRRPGKFEAVALEVV